MLRMGEVWGWDSMAAVGLCPGFLLGWCVPTGVYLEP